GGELDGLADPLVVLDPVTHVQGGRGHGGPQRLDHRVAAGDELGGVPRPARRAAGGPGWARVTAGGTRRGVGRVSPARAAGSGRGGGVVGPALAAGSGRGGRAALGGVAGPQGGGRGGALALERAAAVAAGARARLARLGAARPWRSGPSGTGTAGPRVSCSAKRFSSHRGPSGVSSTWMPISSRPSLIAS